jgi:hypothetical protein
LHETLKIWKKKSIAAAAVAAAVAATAVGAVAIAAVATTRKIIVVVCYY